MEIWDIIVKSNTFNFIIFIAIFAVIIKAAKVGSLIENLQMKVKKFIDDSSAAKEQSVIDLKDAEIAASKAEDEIKEILDSANLNAMRLGRKIMADAHVQSENILFNADKINDSNGKKIISGLSRTTALAAAELAKKHIISTLAKKPQYHAKFIENSINELDRLNLNE